MIFRQKYLLALLGTLLLFNSSLFSDTRPNIILVMVEKGIKEISKKVTEEAGETAIAAVTNDGRLIDESADLLFHLIVLLKSQELSFDEVLIELERRNTNQ